MPRKKSYCEDKHMYPFICLSQSLSISLYRYVTNRWISFSWCLNTILPTHSYRNAYICYCNHLLSSITYIKQFVEYRESTYNCRVARHILSQIIFDLAIIVRLHHHAKQLAFLIWVIVSTQKIYFFLFWQKLFYAYNV